MKARIRNATDVVVERLHRDASVSDQLKFDAWPEEARTIARRAVALEIDKAASEGSDADSHLADTVEAMKLQLGELNAEVAKLLELTPATDPTSDLAVAHSKVRAILTEVGDAFTELYDAAEAEAE